MKPEKGSHISSLRLLYTIEDYQVASSDISSKPVLTSTSVGEALQAFLAYSIDGLEGWAKDRNAE
jgi:hypothetical protein